MQFKKQSQDDNLVQIQAIRKQLAVRIAQEDNIAQGLFYKTADLESIRYAEEVNSWKLELMHRFIYLVTQYLNVHNNKNCASLQKELNLIRADVSKLDSSIKIKNTDLPMRFIGNIYDKHNALRGLGR